MNPFTQSLVRQIKDRELAEFVIHWDLLEALVIRVFKSKTAAPEDVAEHQELRAWLQENIRGWQPSLFAYWQKALVAGEIAQEDPFELLLSVSEAGGFVRNKLAMLNLPAAREALNEYLVARINAGAAPP